MDIISTLIQQQCSQLVNDQQIHLQSGWCVGNCQYRKVLLGPVLESYKLNHECYLTQIPDTIARTLTCCPTDTNSKLSNNTELQDLLLLCGFGLVQNQTSTGHWEGRGVERAGETPHEGGRWIENSEKRNRESRETLRERGTLDNLAPT